MDEQPNKRLSWHVWIVCSLGLFIDGYDLYITSIAEPFIQALYHPSPFMTGLAQAAAPIGAVFGAAFIGPLADHLGRKSMLVFNLIFFVVIALLSACAWNMPSLCVFRFLIGFGVGADYPICAAYLAEMIPAGQSAKATASAMFINCLASPVGVMIAWLMFKIHPYPDVWRWMFASGAIPALIGLLLRVQLPESFLWKVQQQFKHRQLPRKPYKKRFSPQLVKLTIFMSACWFLQDISYYGIGLFTPYVLQAFHLSGNADFLSSATEVMQSTLLVSVFVSLGAFSVIFFIDKVSLIQLQKTGFAFSFLGLLILSLSYFAPDSNKTLLFSGFILFNFFINFGPGITTYLIPAQFFATDIRATGHGIASASGKAGAFLGTILLPILQSSLGIYLTVGLLALTLLPGWVLTHLLGQEVRIDDELPANNQAFSLSIE